MKTEYRIFGVVAVFLLVAAMGVYVLVDQGDTRRRSTGSARWRCCCRSCCA